MYAYFWCEMAVNGYTCSFVRLCVVSNNILNGLFSDILSEKLDLSLFFTFSIFSTWYLHVGAQEEHLMLMFKPSLHMHVHTLNVEESEPSFDPEYGNIIIRPRTGLQSDKSRPNIKSIESSHWITQMNLIWNYVRAGKFQTVVGMR